MSKQKRKKQPIISRTSALVLAALLLLCGAVCLFLGFFHMPIPRAKAVEITGSYQRYAPLSRQYGGDIYLADGSSYGVGNGNKSDELVEALETLPAGERVTLLTHPVFHYVLALEADGDILLNFEDSHSRQTTDTVVFWVLAVPWICGAVYFSLVARRQRTPKRKTRIAL